MRTTLLLAMALPAFMACASTPAPTPDTPARFIACHGNPLLSGRQVQVMLRFTVDETGRPLPGTAMVIRKPDSYSPEWAVSEAKMALGSCEFEPARLDGKPVAAVHTMPMYVPPRSQDP